MDLRLRRVEEREAPSLRHWMDAYFSETAKHREYPVGPIDAAGYRYLPLYWTERMRHPLFIEADGTVVGFALVREVAEGTATFMELAEFFIQPAFRRMGVGRQAAKMIWQTFPGPWKLQVALGNAPAAAFWPRCIEAVASGEVSREEFQGEDGQRIRYVFTVRSGA